MEKRKKVQIEIVFLYEHSIEFSKLIHFEKAISKTTLDTVTINKKQLLGDLLEAVVVDFATWLAVNYQVASCFKTLALILSIDTFIAFRFFVGQNLIGTWRKRFS